MSNFYLSVFLDSIVQTGYTIFVIRSEQNKELPLPNPQTFQTQFPQEGQMYVKAADIEQFHKLNKNHKLNVSAQDERELDAALEKSLKDMDGEGKKPEEPKFVAFTGKGVSLNDGDGQKSGLDPSSELYQTLAAEYGDDPEMI